MKKMLQQLAAYNMWANQRLTAVILSVPEEVTRKPFPGSFNSLYLTLLHMWVAETAWYQRLSPESGAVNPGMNFQGSLQEVIKGLSLQNEKWRQWVDNVSTAQLEESFTYQNSKKETFAEPRYEILLHLFNHGTYHRGQLVSLLHQAGINDQLPSTDFIVFCRLEQNEK